MKPENRNFNDIFNSKKPIIGMVHLKPLPGSPEYDGRGGMKKIITHAVEEARRLEDGGIDGIQIENQFDRPFLKAQYIGIETVAAVTAAAAAIQAAVDLPMGINIHLNGVQQAIAIAQAVGADWIRAFELANAYVSNSGIVEAAGPEALRYRASLYAEEVMILGDFHVKHGSHQIIADRSLTEQAEDVEDSGADALIITGTKTGSAPAREDVDQIRKAVSIPILIGSGLSYENAGLLIPVIDGAIVGSSFKTDGKIENNIDPRRVREFMEKVRQLIQGAG